MGEGTRRAKGDGVTGTTLWVADVTQIVAISLKDGKIEKRIDVPGSVFLNDITTSTTGDVYVSDIVKGSIHVLKGGKDLQLFADVEHPNGLFLGEAALFVATWGSEMKPDFSTTAPGSLLAVDLSTKKVKTISKRLVHSMVFAGLKTRALPLATGRPEKSIG